MSQAGSTTDVSRIQRAATCAIALVGAALVGATFLVGLPAKAAGVEHLTTEFHDSFTEEAIARQQLDVLEVRRLVRQHRDEMTPWLGRELGMSREQLDAFMWEAVPDVARGLERLDAIRVSFEAIYDKVDAHAEDFATAEELPLRGLPATTLPLVFVLPGCLLLAVGLLTLAGPRRFGAGVRATAVAVGAVLLVGPVALSMPQKTQAVDNLTSAFRPVFQDATVAELREHMRIAKALSAELDERGLPILASALGMSREEFLEELRVRVPFVRAGIRDADAIIGRADAIADSIAPSVDDFRLADSIPTSTLPATALPWVSVVAGLMLLGIVAIELALAGRLGAVTRPATLRLPQPNASRAEL